MAGPGLSTTNTVGTGNPPGDANTVHAYIDKLDTTFLAPASNGQALTWDSTSGTYKPVTPFASVPEGWFNVKAAAYGATGNPANNDTTGVQAALTACGTAGGGTVYFPDGTYSCDDLTITSGNTRILLSPNAIIKQRNSGDNHYLLSINPGSGGTTSVSGNKANITIEGGELQGTVAADAFLQHVYLLNINAATNVTVFNVRFVGFRGDGAYIGSGNTGGIERHNVNIKFLCCVFDGVNKDNRNCISVIDCDGFFATGCLFKNSTRTDMPGAIDFEPNAAAAYSVIRNVNLDYCWFENIGGAAAGAVTVWHTATQAALTTKSQGFHFTNLWFRGCTGNSHVFFRQPHQPGNTDTPNDVEIDHIHSIGGTGRPWELAGVKGCKITNSTVDGTPLAAAYGYTYKVLDVEVDGVSFRNAGATDGRLNILFRGTRVFFRDNFSDGGNGEFLRFDVDGGATGASDDVHAWRNVMKNGGTTFTSKAAAHTISGTNTARANDLSGMSTTTIDTTQLTPEVIAASVTYDPPSLATGVAANTTVTATGAAVGDTVVASHTSIETAATSWVVTGYVSAANTVRVVILNATGGTVDLGSGWLGVRVFKQGFLN